MKNGTINRRGAFAALIGAAVPLRIDAAIGEENNLKADPRKLFEK